MDRARLVWDAARRNAASHAGGEHLWDRDGQIAWGRVYMESVEEDGIDLDERVRRMAEGEN